jgi:hypothetical protein
MSEISLITLTQVSLTNSIFNCQRPEKTENQEEMITSLRQAINKAKEKIEMDLPEVDLAYLNGQFVYLLDKQTPVNKKIKKGIIELWDKLGILLVKYDLAKAYEKANKGSLKAGQIENKIRLLESEFEKSGTKAISSKNILSEISGFVIGSNLYIGKASTIFLENHNIEKIDLIFTNTTSSRVVENNEVGDICGSEIIDSSFIKQEGTAIPVITQEDLLTGRIKIDVGMTVWKDSTELGNYYFGGGYMQKLFSLKGEHIGYYDAPPGPYEAIKNLNNKPILENSAKNYQEFYSNPCLKENNGESLVFSHYVTLSDFSSIVSFDVWQNVNLQIQDYPPEELDEFKISIVYNNNFEPIAFAFGKLGYINDNEGKTIFYVESIPYWQSIGPEDQNYIEGGNSENREFIDKAIPEWIFVPEE